MKLTKEKRRFADHAIKHGLSFRGWVYDYNYDELISYLNDYDTRCPNITNNHKNKTEIKYSILIRYITNCRTFEIDLSTVKVIQYGRFWVLRKIVKPNRVYYGIYI